MEKQEFSREEVSSLLHLIDRLHTQEVVYQVALGILLLGLAYISLLLWIKTQELKRVITVYEIQKGRFAKTIKERTQYIQ